jgi:hypothetical protein
MKKIPNPILQIPTMEYRCVIPLIGILSIGIWDLGFGI